MKNIKFGNKKGENVKEKEGEGKKRKDIGNIEVKRVNYIQNGKN
jgi:hypothetical protein